MCVPTPLVTHVCVSVTSWVVTYCWVPLCLSHVRCSSDGKISFNINICISLKLRCVEENLIVLCDEHLCPNVIIVLLFSMCNLACHKAKLREISIHFLWLAAIVRELLTGTEMFLEMLIYSPFNHPRELPAWESVTELICHENFRLFEFRGPLLYKCFL